MINYRQVKTYPINNVITTLFGHEYEITSYLKDNVQWNKVMSVMVSYKNKYNDFAGRFLKSTLVHYAIYRFSNHKIKYIDEIGCDFFVPEKNIRLEFKGGLKMFQHNAKTTVEIKLKNFNGYETPLEKTFDYLVLCDGNTVGVVSFENILPYTSRKDDGIYGKIPYNVIEFFIETGKIKDTKINLIDIEKRIIEEALDKVEASYAI